MTRKQSGKFRFLLATTCGCALFPRSGQSVGVVAHHERIQVRPVKVGGKPGFKVKLTLVPESYQAVRVGLGKMKVSEELAKNAQSQNPNFSDAKRALAGGAAKGYLRHQFGEVKFTDKHPQNQYIYPPKEMEWTVMYGQGNDLKPGDMVDVVSAWDKAGGPFDSPHVFGMHDGPVTQGDKTSVITLPKPPKPKAK